MRDFKGMKRQRGRNRKPGGGGGANNANPNRSWDSQGPENIKVRGNAQTVYERYMQLARDASASGDRVLAENYLQHAEHYFRVLRALQPARPVSEIAQRELSSQGFDIDFEDESGAQAAAFLAAQQAEQQRQQVEQQRQQADAERAAARDAADRTEARAENGDNGRDGEAREGGRRETRRERWERRRDERGRRFDAENGETPVDEAPAGGDAEDEGGAASPGAGVDMPAPADVDEGAPGAAPPDAGERPARRPRAPRARAEAADVDAAAALPGFLTRSPTPEAEGDAAPRRRAPRRRADTPSEE